MKLITRNSDAFGALTRRVLLASLLSLASLPAFAQRAKPETITITTFGDSLFHGYGLPPSQSMSAVLGSWLRDEGWNVRIDNASVSGDTTAGGRNRIAWTLGNDPAAYPDLLIVELGANDMLRGVQPSQTRINLAAILQAAQERDIPVFLIGIRSLSNYGDAYKDAFDAIFPELAERYETGFHPYIFRGLQDIPASELAGFMQDDGIHPNQRGVVKLIEDIGPDIAVYLRGLGFTPD